MSREIARLPLAVRVSRGKAMRRSAGVLLRFASVQGAAQLVALVTGVLVVRELDKTHYAQYAILTSLTAAMTLLSESGVTSGLMRLGANLVGDVNAMSTLFSCALRFRRQTAIAVLIFGGLALILLLLRNNASLLATLTYTVITSVTFWPILSKGTLQAYFRIRRWFQYMQVITLYSAILRLMLIVVLAVAYRVDILSLVLIGLVCALFEVRLYVSRTRGELHLSRRVHRVQAYEKTFRANLRQTMPMNLVLVSQTQLLYFFLGAFGSTSVLAEIAAISRFALVFTVLNQIVGDIGSGAVARAAPRPRVLVAVMGRFLGGFSAAAAVIVLMAAAFSTPLVRLLGAGYGGLETPLVIIALGAAAINLADGFRFLNQARGWLAWSWIYIPGTALWAGVGILVLDLSDVTQAAWLVALQAVPALVTQAVCFGAGIRRMRVDATSGARGTDA